MKLFNQINRLENAMDATWLRQEVIAQNLANASTPGYKSSRVEFETAFRNALAKDGQNFALKRTRDKHMEFSEQTDPMKVRAQVVVNASTTMRMDDNNVDPDYEMTELAKNTIQYDALTTKLNAELARIKMVIREGK